ncbi:MAG: hypothetical protein E2O59_12615 [Gammaproteobacteria bacterium]|nr:MAG: hypothetical protein E2O59_12615 [Gammaproteobacteria bacterium]
MPEPDSTTLVTPPTDRDKYQSRLTRVFLTAGLLTLVAASWSGFLDNNAQTTTEASFKRALATFALARGLNGVISVAQGTEIAIQPLGVGLTITAGEILDPLNDLVERFSWLALVACASLGTQMLMTELLSNVWISSLLSVTVLAYLFVLWWPKGFAGREILLKICLLLVFIRFVFTVVTLASGWINSAVLVDRQEASMERIAQTTENIELLQVEDTDASLLERFSTFLDEQRQVFDVRAQLLALKERVESAIEALVDLIIVFVVQTLILPILGLFASVRVLKRVWRWAT